MGKDFGITINVDDTIRDLQQWDKKKVQEVSEVIHDAGFIIEGEVKSSIAGQREEPTSVDTGHFLQSITTDNSKDFETKVYSDVNYSEYLEEGTLYINARHHFSNSLERKEPEVIKNLDRVMKD